MTDLPNSAADRVANASTPDRGTPAGDPEIAALVRRDAPTDDDAPWLAALVNIGRRLVSSAVRAAPAAGAPERPIDGTPAAEDHVYELTSVNGDALARFSWTPKTPGREIIYRVIPFVMLALSAFAVLAGLVFRHMRQTAQTIAATETRLRHLAMHDPLCALPNRMFFGERLEATIDRVREAGGNAAVFYIDLDHFKDVNDTLGHHVATSCCAVSPSGSCARCAAMMSSPGSAGTSLRY